MIHRDLKKDKGFVMKVLRLFPEFHNHIPKKLQKDEAVLKIVNRGL
jgi:hypothetical protein